MDVAIALTVAQTLFATLQCAEVRKLCSVFNYKSELQNLIDTVNTIKNFLLDANSKCQELTNEGQNWVENLKDAVYDADDLLDEFKTIAQQRGGKFSSKVRRFFSSNNPLLFTLDTSCEIKKISLGDREDEAVTSLVEIGKEIVRKCANVPLSIRVIGSLLRNEDIATWQSLKSNDLANMYDGKDSIMPTLLFSYYHLSPELKSCFSFCSVFPEDCFIQKELLLSLWMALGYLVPSAKTESMEDVGEKYVSILMNRCFFQDIIMDRLGEVISFKMHDLIHDLARKVAAKESSTLTACRNGFEGKVRHLFIDSNKGLVNWLSSSNSSSNTLRTCLKNRYTQIKNLEAIISKCSRLRVLEWHDSLTTIETYQIQ